MSNDVAHVGRPTDYKKEYCEQVKSLCLLGLTNDQLAENFEICVATLHNWRNEHPEFLDAIKKGRAAADATVASSLYKRAHGYTDDDGKHIPASDTAMIFWLKNRQPAMWRDRVEQKIDANINHTIDKDTLEHFNTEY